MSSAARRRFSTPGVFKITRRQGISNDRSGVFECIAFFESGKYNIDPRLLTSVMAIVSGNSIYVAKPLLCNPSEILQSHEVKRIIENLGRPGIAMLILPQSPRSLNDAVDDWRLVNHGTLNGKEEDCFSHISLHVSFTGYEKPVSVGLHGFQDIEICLLEATFLGL